MTKYPITCINCESYLGEFESDEEVKAEGHRILDMSGCEASVMCNDCGEPHTPKTYKFATFTSFRSGGHNIEVQKYLEEVIAIIQNIITEGECQLIGITVEQAIERVSYLKIGDNTLFEFSDSTWVVVQRLG